LTALKQFGTDSGIILIQIVFDPLWYRLLKYTDWKLARGYFSRISSGYRLLSRYSMA